MANMQIKKVTIELEDGTIREVNKGIILGLEKVEESPDERKLSICLHQINPLEVANVMCEADRVIRRFVAKDILEKLMKED